MSALDELLKQQKDLNEKIEALRKDEKKSALATIAELVSTYQITANDIAKVCGYQPVEVSLKKKEVKKAEPKWQYVLNGVAIKWAGRGNPKTFPQTLKDYLKQKNITIAQFKADPKHKITVA